ncbi:hypothetical protein HOY80DRAFT_884675, partial [Tuber brumale]
TLRRYCYAYTGRLFMPSSSGGPNNTMCYSPVLEGGRGRELEAHIGRDALTAAVCKNFYAQPIQENDVIMNSFLYLVVNQRYGPALNKGKKLLRFSTSIL